MKLTLDEKIDNIERVIENKMIYISRLQNMVNDGDAIAKIVLDIESQYIIKWLEILDELEGRAE